MGLSASVRVLGFTPIEEFVGYMAACDIVLNLRYPTVGESSGTLLRALGLGKAVLVSEVGSFQEFPDDVCLKVPVGAGEEDLIFEYLNLLVSRPEVARALGERARDYVAARVQLGGGGARSMPASWKRWWRARSGPTPARGRRCDAAAAAGAAEPLPQPRDLRLSARLGHQRRVRAATSKTHQTRLRQDARNHAAGRPVRPHPGDGRVPADHAGAAHQAGLRRGARLLLRASRDASTIAR